MQQPIVNKWKLVKTWRLRKNIMLTVNLLLIAWLVFEPGTIFHFNDKAHLRGKTKALNGLNIRTRPAFDASVIVNVPYNSLINIQSTDGPTAILSGHTNTWYKVEYSHFVGWAWGDYIDTAYGN